MMRSIVWFGHTRVKGGQAAFVNAFYNPTPRHLLCYAVRRRNPFGGYEILGLQGAGGMGEVYRARDVRLRRDVAIKVQRRESRARDAI